MRFAYADPPYLGTSSFGAEHHYGHQHDGAADYDKLETHERLIERLSDEFPDGWALSLHSPSLRLLLPLCPEDVRVSPWVKPFCSFKRGVNPAYAWEPVIWRGGRSGKDRAGGAAEPTTRDWVSAAITTKKGTSGAKPYAFCAWLFDLLGMTPDDEFVDVFPGSGAVGAAWEKWRAARPLDFTAEAYENVELGA